MPHPAEAGAGHGEEVGDYGTDREKAVCGMNLEFIFLRKKFLPSDFCLVAEIFMLR